MKRLISIFLLIMSVNCMYSQDQLRNSYLRQVAIYGGMEDGGITTTRYYTCIAQEKLRFVNLQYQGQPIEMNKRDTVIFKLETYTPYSNKDDIDETLNDIPYVYGVQAQKHKYIITIHSVDFLEWVSRYAIGKLEYNVQFKTEIDENHSYYAP